MANAVILTKNHPSELTAIAKAEAFHISLLGGPAGELKLKEQQGWWDEQNQEAEWLVTTLELDTTLPFDEAWTLYNQQVVMRALEGFVHARSFSSDEKTLVYNDLRKTPGWERPQNDSSSNSASFRSAAGG